MPIAAVTAPIPPSDTSASGGSGVPASSPSSGFAEALVAQGVDPNGDPRGLAPRGLPSVSLGAMVAALAGEPAPIATSSAGAVADAWGAAADRPSVAAAGPGQAVLSAGERYLGVPYVWGGTDPAKGFDCSGFVQQVYGDLGVSLPRVSIDQSKAGVAVDGLDAARPGDLVFWKGSGARPNHIGIYAGEGRMLVAPSSGDVVRYQEITRTPDAVRRVIA